MMETIILQLNVAATKVAPRRLASENAHIIRV